MIENIDVVLSRLVLSAKYLLKIQMTVLHQKMVHAPRVSLLPYCTIAILRIERLENYMFCSKEKYEELSSRRTNISFSNPFLLLFLLYTKRLFIHVDREYRVQTMIYSLHLTFMQYLNNSFVIFCLVAAAKTSCNYPFYDALSLSKSFCIPSNN